MTHKFYFNGAGQAGLADLIAANAMFAGASFEMHQMLVITTEDDRLARVIEALTGEKPETRQFVGAGILVQCDPVLAAIEEPVITGKGKCRYCGKPCREKVCSADECKRARSRDYWRETHRKPEAGPTEPGTPFEAAEPTAAALPEEWDH